MESDCGSWASLLVIPGGGEESIRYQAIAETYKSLRLRFKFLSPDDLREKALDIVKEKNEKTWKMIIFKVWETNENRNPDRSYSLYTFFTSYHHPPNEKNIEHYHKALEHFYRGIWISRNWPTATRKLHSFDEAVDTVSIIENVNLSQSYELEKMRLQKEQKDCNELLLFHGTSQEAMKSILR